MSATGNFITFGFKEDRFGYRSWHELMFIFLGDSTKVTDSTSHIKGAYHLFVMASTHDVESKILEYMKHGRQYMYYHSVFISRRTPHQICTGPSCAICNQVVDGMTAHEIKVGFINVHPTLRNAGGDIVAPHYRIPIGKPIATKGKRVPMQLPAEVEYTQKDLYKVLRDNADRNDYNLDQSYKISPEGIKPPMVTEPSEESSESSDCDPILCPSCIAGNASHAPQYSPFDYIKQEASFPERKFDQK